MSEEYNLEPLLKIYESVHVLEIKVLNTKLKNLYIEKANNHNKNVFNDPINAGINCFNEPINAEINCCNNNFYFFLPEEKLLSKKKKYTPFQLDIQLKRVCVKSEKNFPVEVMRINIVNNGLGYCHYLDQRMLQKNITGVFECFDEDKNIITLPELNPCFCYKICKYEPLYIKIVDKFSFNNDVMILGSGYHRGTFHDGFVIE